MEIIFYDIIGEQQKPFVIKYARNKRPFILKNLFNKNIEFYFWLPKMYVAFKNILSYFINFRAKFCLLTPIDFWHSKVNNL